jgi:hypothetical protein
MDTETVELIEVASIIGSTPAAVRVRWRPTRYGWPRTRKA